MNPTTTLRVCVISEWLLIIIGIILSFTLESSLPEPLQEYLTWELEKDIDLIDVVTLIVLPPLLLIAIISSVGLLFLKNWARWLYLWTTIAMFAVEPFLGPTVVPAFEAAIDETSVLLSGVVIGISFFGGAIKARVDDSLVKSS